MAGMWDERFAREDYLFGTEPADFLRRAARYLPDGARVLCMADGEGRNSVFLAGLGHEVTAFDASAVGLEKARKLAEKQEVKVHFSHAGVEEWDWSREWDAVVAIFIQFAPPEMRKAIFEGFRQAVKPGGLLILHGYSLRQPAYSTGGPRDPAHLYTEEMLRDWFGDWEILELAEYDAEIHEGAGHSGLSALVDLVARRPETG